MSDDTIIHRALHHPPVVVWQIWFRQVVDDIDQVQDNTVVMLRMLVFRFADDIDRDTERYSTTLTVFMWITRLTIRRGHTTDILSHYMKKHVERSDNHMTLNMTLDEETPSWRSHNRVRNRRFPQVYLPSLAIQVDRIQSLREMWGAGRHIACS